MRGPDIASTPLLVALQRHSNASGYKTVQDYLYPSELPCVEVMEVLKEVHVDSQQTLQFSATNILGFMLACKTHCKADASGSSPLQPSQFFISKLVTVDRFLQFTFEYWLGLRRQSTGKDAAQPVLTDSDLNTLTTQLIQGWAGLVCSLLEANPNSSAAEDENNLFTSSVTESFDAHQIAFYSCGCLIRLNHYARFRPSLLSPLWKAICNVVDSLSSVPDSIMETGTAALSVYLKEGLNETILSVSAMLIQQVNQSMPVTIDTAKLQFGQKILLFLISRLAAFLSQDSSCLAEPDAIAALLAIMGVNGAVQSRLAQATPDATSFFHLHQKLSDKAKKTLLTFVLGRDGQSALDGVRRRRLARLWKVTPPSWPETSSHAGLVHPAFAVGKTNLLMKLVDSCVGNPSPEVLSETEANSMLRICQELLLVALPLCHEVSIRATTSESGAILIDAVVANVSRAFLVCANLAPSLAPGAVPGRSRFHEFLLGLLVSPSSGSMHPLSREAVITVLHLHLLGLSETNTSACNNLLGLAVKLLFTPKLCTDLRSNLTSLLSIILDGPPCHLRESSIQLIHKEATRLDRSLELDSASRKRKRRSEGQHPRPDDLRLICRVVAKCSLGDTAKCASTSHIPLAEAAATSLSRASVRAALATAACRCGTDSGVKHEYAALIEFVRRNLATGTRQSTSSLALKEALLGYIRWSCREEVMVETELHRLSIFLLSVCETASEAECQGQLGLLYELIYSLGDFARRASADGSPEALNAVGNAFNTFLSKAANEARSETLSVLVSCFQSMSSDHKALLLKIAVPKVMRRYIQRRLEGKAAEDVISREDSLVHHLASSEKLRCLSGCIQLIDNVLSFTKCFRIQLGSFVLQMPTGDERSSGRSALAIFPPGEDSIEDIRFIHGGAQVDTLFIQRMEVADDGSLKIYIA